MDQDDISLNLSDYTINDTLQLLKLPVIEKITSQDMKSARKLVLMTHPDKSNLDAKYFRFYLKAYERIEELVTFAQRSSIDTSAYLRRYQTTGKELDAQIEAPSLIKAGFLNKEGNRIGNNYNDFKKKFHKWFDKHGELLNNNEGYDDFLKSSKDLLKEGASQEESKIFMEQRRRNLQALTISQGIQEYDSWSSSSLASGNVGEDLQKAYTETVVPVSDEDFKNKKKYSSIDELKRDRHQTVSNLDYEASNLEYFNNKKKSEAEDLKRYFDQLSIMEKNQDAVRKFKNDLFRLGN